MPKRRGVEPQQFEEIECADEQSARALAAERQAAEQEPGAEWIYLRNRSRQWVARRIPPGAFPRRLRRANPAAESFLEAIINLWTR